MSRLVKMLGTLRVVKYIWDQIIAVYSKLFANSTPRTVIPILLKYLNFSQNSRRVKFAFVDFYSVRTFPKFLRTRTMRFFCWTFLDIQISSRTIALRWKYMVCSNFLRLSEYPYTQSHSASFQSFPLYLR